MATFRLYNIEENCLELFLLDDHPPYLATSHVWKENVFPRDQRFRDCFGGRGVAAVIKERYPHIQYCWFDTRCINQDDEQDKLIQIPLMDQIYGEAECVVIFLTTHLNANQAQVDWLLEKIDGALAMCLADAWNEESEYWQYGEGRGWIATAMRAVMRLAGTPWATRVWTLQEYVLAKKVIWIGQDLQPIEVDDYVFSALPDICDTLALVEFLTPEFRALGQYFMGMANARLGNIDRTRVVELSALRQATVPVDQIYGIMAASGVIVPPQADEPITTVWSRWCEEAIKQGHVRWLLLPASSGALVGGEQETCILPHFAQRHQLSACSGLDNVRPLGPIAILDGTVVLSARTVGTAHLTTCLGTVHESREGRINRDITLILFANAKWARALKLVWAFGGGRYNVKQARSIAQVLVQSYTRAARMVALCREDGFRPMISSHFQQYVWDDFMLLQQSMMLGVNHGNAYLCEIRTELADSVFVPAVLVLGRPPQQRRFHLLDFEARSPDGRSMLMAVEDATLPDGSGVYHKVGMTLGISEDVSEIWRSMRTKEVRIGGHGCSGCQRNLSTRVFVSPPEHNSIPLNRHITSRRLRILERHENRVRLKLFSTKTSSSSASTPTRWIRLRQRRWRQSLEGMHDILRKSTIAEESLPWIP